ncbi:MAG: RecX family transcriptional regulator [Tuberibacillus sp.]
MVKIVKISVHEKMRHYYNVTFINNESRTWDMPVHEDVLVTKGLRKGLELSQEELVTLEKIENQNKAYQAALNYLSYRMRSIKEMQAYLRKKDFNDHIITSTIARLSKENWLNDLNFAEAYVRTKMNAASKGPLLIYNELRQKGISEDDARAALKEYPIDLQYKNALKFAEKKQNGLRTDSYHEQNKKIAFALQQKGYEREIISTVIQALPKGESTKEREALAKQAEKALQRFKGLDLKEKRFKLKAYLYRKGFPPDLIEAYLNDGNDEGL